ncbi:uncharacterized protein PAC_09331 [Phialocephala subalpina]|uniref:C2H2-type domain-containing protein n=1 Tax=Phialocephala subalpina TaxID=576137 RepID=A0A1L7X337_9HELO|nr:uncharacterized protein PAC_09331 [Phialocephala subalpina]
MASADDRPNKYSNENLPSLKAGFGHAILPSHESTHLPPLREILNYGRPRPQPPPQRVEPPKVSRALADAIYTIDDNLLRSMVIEYCESLPALREGFETKLLVKAKDVARYHADSDSEDDKESLIGSSPEDADYDSKGEKKPKPIALMDDELTPRYATCENCTNKFDVTKNDERQCFWHTGDKEVNDDDDFWADHDEDCHGIIDDLKDDSTYDDGFKWSCCGENGSSPGCKSTKHKAGVNQVVEKVSSRWRKRKAEEDLPRHNRFAPYVGALPRMPGWH